VCNCHPRPLKQLPIPLSNDRKLNGTRRRENDRFGFERFNSSSDDMITVEIQILGKKDAEYAKLK